MLRLRKSDFYSEFHEGFCCKLLVSRNERHPTQEFQESVINSKLHSLSSRLSVQNIFARELGYCAVIKRLLIEGSILSLYEVF